jgi:hypothetical protein
MPIQLNEENCGKILVLQVSGKLVREDYEHFVPEFERLVRQHGKLRVFFDMTAGRSAPYGRTSSSLANTSPTSNGSRWLGKRSGSTAWRRSANHSRRRQSDTSTTTRTSEFGRGRLDPRQDLPGFNRRCAPEIRNQKWSNLK